VTLRIRVAGLLVHSGHVLLVKHRAHDFWLLPGGRLDDGESLVDCAERELWEETGLRIRAQGPIFLGDFLTGKKHIVDVILRVALSRQAQRLPSLRQGPDKGLAAVQWFPIQGVPKLGPPPLGEMLIRTGFAPENVWGRIQYGGMY
jgi:8-oxo-dGTP pyrophosphatase MutT (NUDIX family)